MPQARGRTRALIFLIALGSGAAGAADRSDSPRPRIGLVLAGGGARGGAHVGALKVLEELRIPVDYVAGTSMGSIVGGLYCDGYSPTEMDDTLSQVDWANLFRDAPARPQMSFRRKEDDNLALFPFTFGIGPQGMSAPSGIIAGQKIDFLFRSLTLDASNLKSFDQLRIPYRAVAADLMTGDPVILDHGDLSRAMRASMSIPGALTPVELEGRLLVDGGIAENLPVSVVQDMGAERIIAIDVGTPPKSQVDYLSAAGVYAQAFSVMGEKNVTEQKALLGPGDLLITPDLTGISAGSFDKIRAAVDAGEKAARSVIPELRAFSVSAEEYAAYLKRQRRESSSSATAIRIDEIAIEGTQRVAPKMLQSRIRTRPGELLDLDRLASDLKRVSQAGDFETVGYRIDREDGKNKLVVQVKEKWWGPGFLRFGIGVEATSNGSSEYRLVANYRQTSLNRLGAEWKTVLSAGEPLGVFTEFYQPLESSGSWFIAPRAVFVRERSETYLQNGDREILDEHRLLGGLDFGFQLGNYGEIRVGVFTGRLRVDTDTASTFVPVNEGVGGARFKLALDRVDNVFFPTRGNLTELDVVWSLDRLGADQDSDKLEFRTYQAVPAGKNTFLGGLNVRTALGSDLQFFDQFELGGFLNLSGLPRGKLRGDVVGLATVGDYFKIGRLGLLGKLYAGGFVQAGNAWPDGSAASFSDLLYSGTFFFGVDSKFAPVYIAYGLTEGGEGAAYVLVGRLIGR